MQARCAKINIQFQYAKSIALYRKKSVIKKTQYKRIKFKMSNI